jgi:hypothetical protein
LFVYVDTVLAVKKMYISSVRLLGSGFRAHDLRFIMWCI